MTPQLIRFYSSIIFMDIFKPSFISSDYFPHIVIYMSAAFKMQINFLFPTKTSIITTTIDTIIMFIEMSNQPNRKPSQNRVDRNLQHYLTKICC